MAARQLPQQESITMCLKSPAEKQAVRELAGRATLDFKYDKAEEFLKATQKDGLRKIRETCRLVIQVDSVPYKLGIGNLHGSGPVVNLVLFDEIESVTT